MELDITNIYLEPKWGPFFCLEFRPCVEGLTFKNRGHLGSRYIYIYKWLTINLNWLCHCYFFHTLYSNWKHFRAPTKITGDFGDRLVPLFPQECHSSHVMGFLNSPKNWVVTWRDASIPAVGGGRYCRSKRFFGGCKWNVLRKKIRGDNFDKWLMVYTWVEVNEYIYG